MPRAYTLTPRPRNLSTTATLIHRLKHPLHIQRVRHPSLLASNSGSVRTESDKRLPRVEVDWLGEPTSQESPYELIDIEDKGDYTEQRHGDVNVYWNSVMVEASPEEKERRRAAKEGKRREKRNGRIFQNSEQLYKAYNNRQHGQSGTKRSTAVSEQTRVISNPTQTPARIDGSSHATTHLNYDAVEDRYIKLNENTSTRELYINQTVNPELTWNSALTRILASPSVDHSIASAIIARARDRPRNREENSHEVNMRELSMVPNFSYPIANARWCDACQASDWLVLDGEGRAKRTDEEVESEHQLPNGVSSLTNGSNDDVNFLNFTQSRYVDKDSLYRAHTSTPAERRTSDPGSILKDILDPEELEMYREIMSHNPRFTVLLEQADISRQVSLIQKLHTVVELLGEKVADLKDHMESKGCRDLNRGRTEFETLLPFIQKKEGVDDLRRALAFSNRVINGCWRRERSMLNALLDIQRRKQVRRNFLARLLPKGYGITDTCAEPSNNACYDSMAANDALLGQTALNALVHIAAQNVQILREDGRDVVELTNRCSV